MYYYSAWTPWTTMVWSITRLPGVFSRSDKTWEMPRGSSRTVHWADRSWFVLASRFSCRSLFNPNKYWFRFQFPLLTLFDMRVIIFKVSSFFSFLRVFLFLDGSTCILLFVCLVTIDVFAFIVLWIFVKLGGLLSFCILTVHIKHLRTLNTIIYNSCSNSRIKFCCLALRYYK